MPLRLRLTLAFAAIMALVVGGLGTFVYLRLAAELDQAIAAELGASTAQLAVVAREEADELGKPGENELVERGEKYDQFLTPSGGLVDASPLARKVQLLDPRRLARVSAGEEVTFDRPEGAGLSERLRVRAKRVAAGDRPLVAVVAVSLLEHDEGLSSLAALLLLGGPVAVLLASAAGYGLATAALRPVEAMRRRAAAISPSEPGKRLPVPRPRDEVRRLGETLNEMLARQEEAFERERRFVADASHELRTPLAVLKAEVDLALRRSRSPEELVDALRSAREETDRLARLAEDLLVIARSDQGRLPVRPEPVELASVLTHLSNRFAPRFEEGGRDLTIDVDGLVVSADRLRLEQAVGNLMDNALRHGRGRVRLWADEDGEDRVRVHVSDDGPGFSADFLPSAFERFTRADPARSRGGTGLGLAIVEAIARAHGGAVRAERGEGGGADVWIALPRVRPPRPSRETVEV